MVFTVLVTIPLKAASLSLVNTNVDSVPSRPFSFAELVVIVAAAFVPLIPLKAKNWFALLPE